MVTSVGTANLEINGDRLNGAIRELAEIGRLPEGGVRRLSFSPDDLRGRQLIKRWMQAAGMSIRCDAAGNTIGTYRGRYPEAAVLATGSHLDTVPSGGRYDGTLGVVAGIEMVRTLQERGIRLDRSIEVVAFTDDEGGMLGSKAMSGTLPDDPDTYPTASGVPVRNCLAQIGGSWHSLPTARRHRDEIAAFVELHVEQGGVLESQGVPIGIVEGIVSQQRYTLQFVGRPNHAGTTPMEMRRDALIAAAPVILLVERLAKEAAGGCVATVGKLDVWPNAANIVPGRVELSVDIRDLDAGKVAGVAARLRRECEVLAEAAGIEFAMAQILDARGTLATETIQAAIARSCQHLGLSYAYLPSRASHDAQEIGRFTDMGMIFVPSEQGISHSEAEYTTPEQCTWGANVLLQTFLQLDRAYPAISSVR